MTHDRVAAEIYKALNQLTIPTVCGIEDEYGWCEGAEAILEDVLSEIRYLKSQMDVPDDDRRSQERTP